MNQSAPSAATATPEKTRGEIYVWFTGIGLTLGLCMILFLLLLIIRNGAGVFWPQPVGVIEFSDERETTFRGGKIVAGIQVYEKAISAGSLTAAQLESENPDDRLEKKLYIGNRDAYRQSFAYFSVGDVEKVTYPEEILVLERIEWGNAIVFPSRLVGPDNFSIAAEDPAFEERLRQVVKEVRQRRQQINKIERRQIGSISARITNLQRNLNYLERRQNLTPKEIEEMQFLTEKLEALQLAYLPLAEQAAALRQENNIYTLHYRLATGEERTESVGHLVHFHAPNRMSVVAKIGHFFFQIREFLIRFPREANTEGGIFPAIFGTFVMTLLMSVAVTPFGVLAAIYLREYARQGPLVRAVRIAINNLAGVPSIVFGVFGLGFFIYFVGDGVDHLFFPRAVESNTPVFGTGGILWASLTLALMTVPVVIVATEEALSAVSRGVREGSLACGASKWQTIRHLVLPASLPGILTGLILAMARGAGEVAPLMLVGVVALAPNLPIDGEFPFIHLERKFMHLGFHIYDLGFQSPDSEAAQPMVFATTLVLILLVIILNLAAMVLRNYLKRKYSAGAF